MTVLPQNTFTADSSQLSLNDAAHPGDQNECDHVDAAPDLIMTVSLVDRKGLWTTSGELMSSNTMTGDAVCW